MIHRALLVTTWALAIALVVLPVVALVNGTTLGLTLVAVGGLLTAACYHWVHELSDHPGLAWQGISQLVGVPLAIGYSQIVVALARTRVMAPVTRAFANVGRMALTNYLSHTLICTTIEWPRGTSA